MHVAKIQFHKNMRIEYAPSGVCYAPYCMPPLWVAWKVLLSGMQILEYHGSFQCYLLHVTNAACCMPSVMHHQ